MTNEELLRERVAKLEVQMTRLSEQLDDTHKKVAAGQGRALGDRGTGWWSRAGIRLDGEGNAVVGDVAEVVSAFSI